MRDIHQVPLQQLRKHELRALIVEMRLRHDDDINAILALVSEEDALKVSLKLARWKIDRATSQAAA